MNRHAADLNFYLDLHTKNNEGPLQFFHDFHLKKNSEGYQLKNLTEIKKSRYFFAALFLFFYRAILYIFWSQNGIRILSSIILLRTRTIMHQ